MELSPIQLQIQKWSDNGLSFGCLLEGARDGKLYVYRYVGDNYNSLTLKVHGIKVIDDYGSVLISDIELYSVIGHPMDYGRLCYLASTSKGGYEGDYMGIFSVMLCRFLENPILYNQTMLERDEETQILVRDFLLSLPK